MADSKMEKFLTDNSYHLMTADEADSFGRLAGESFPLDYPLFTYLFGKNVDRARVVDTVIAQYRQISRCGLCYSLEDTKYGNVAVETQETGSPSIFDTLGSGVFGLLFRYGPSTMIRLLRYDRFCSKLRNRMKEKNLIYVKSLCVAKEYQGHNVIEELALPLIMYADNTNATLYFETHSKSHVSMYQHYGFELIETTVIPGSDIEQYIMIKRP